jgi:PAS domain S-box-containing protein
MARILLLMGPTPGRVTVVAALREAGQTPLEPPESWLKSTDTQSLVAIVEKAAPDVVVLGADPDLNRACERCEQLMDDERTRAIPTLVCVARTPSESQTTQILAAGARDVLSLSDPPALVSARIDNMARLNHLRRVFRVHHDALQARNQELDRVFETVASGLAIADSGGNVVRMNSSAFEILGARERHFATRTRPGGAAASTVADREDHPLHRAAMRGERVRGERFVLLDERTGGDRVLVVDAEPIVSEEGDRLGGVAVFRDETESIRLQETLREKAAELAQRTEEMEAFVYTASHDMKSPLWTIRRYAAMIVEDHGDALPEDVRHILSRVEVNATRLGSLVDDLVRVVKVGKMELMLEPVPADQPVRDALRGLDAAIRQADARIVVQSDMPTLLVDPDRMVDLFVNLIGNAIKYRAPERPCTVEVGGETSPEGAHIWVRDNGIGVPEDQFDRIFGLFQRLHTRDQIEGSGLGLAIVKRIAERHGGRVWVESVLGEGSTFHVQLPVP